MKKNKKLGMKVFWTTLFAVLLIMGIFISIFAYQIEGTIKNSENELSENLIKSYDELIAGEVYSMYTMLDAVYSRIESGELSEKQGLEIGADLIRQARYGKTGYFWVDDLKGNCVVHPMLPKVEGKNRIDFTDSKGNKPLEEMINGASKGDSVFIDFYWPKKEGEEPIRKRGFGMLYKPFGWVIGTGNYIDDIEAIVSTSHNKIKSELVTAYIILATVGGVAVILVCIFFYIFSVKLSKDFGNINHDIKELSNYNLAYESKKDYSKRRDEIGNLFDESIKLKQSLFEIIKNIGEHAQNTAATAEELTATAQNSAEAAGDVSIAVNNIADGATGQANDTMQAAQEVDNNNRVLEKVINSLNDLSLAISDIDNKKEEGKFALGNLIEISNENESEALVVNKIINDTNESAESISKASEMIQSIADQTNLLALNAAIEAARAGEAGKGFAVVAEEIRKLAEDSTTFTAEIREIINELRIKTEKAVETMRNVGIKMKEQNNNAKETQDKFTDIENAVDKSKLIVYEVNSASKDISEINEKINKAIQSLSAIAEENAATSQEASAAVEIQVESIRDISKASENLAKIATELQEEVAEFKL